MIVGNASEVLHKCAVLSPGVTIRPLVDRGRVLVIDSDFGDICPPKYTGKRSAVMGGDMVWCTEFAHHVFVCLKKIGSCSG
jgi:hypothetical protein